MKNLHLQQLILTGILTGAIISQAKSWSQEALSDREFMELIKETGGNITYQQLDEEGLLLELSADNAQTFRSLSSEGKKLALQLASRSCNGTNDCKGQNACRTDLNKCAGMGTCKGTTKCAFSDKNVAVRVAAKLMAEKRAKAIH
jgi:hypothetical protein